MNIVESMCRREEFRNLYEEDIRVRSTMFFVLSSAYHIQFPNHAHTQEACKMLSKDNAIPISYIFTGEPPSASLAYKRTVELCVNKLDVCEEDTNLAETFQKISRKDRNCWLCHVISRDFVSTLQRYRTVDRKVVFRALDDLCSRIAIRYPKRLGLKLEVTGFVSLRLRPLIHNTHNKQEKCDELVEDDDKLSDIADCDSWRTHRRTCPIVTARSILRRLMPVVTVRRTRFRL